MGWAIYIETNKVTILPILVKMLQENVKRVCYNKRKETALV
jgi:hypothetical protein